MKRIALRQWEADVLDGERQEQKLEKKYDSRFRVVFDAVRELMSAESSGSRPIGFRQKAVD